MIAFQASVTGHAAHRLADLAQRRARRDRLRVDAQLDHRGPAGRDGALERGRELLRPLDHLAVAAEGLRVAREVRVDEVGAEGAAGVVPLLVHPDRPVHAVVDDQHDDRQLVLDGGRELLAAHQEVAVAGEAHDQAIRVDELGGDRGRQAVAHGAARRRELRREAAELVEAVRPDGEVAGAVREDRVLRQPLAQPRHHLAHLHVAGPGRVLHAREVVGVRLLGLGAPGRRVDGLQRPRRRGELR